jgi:uncharacterized protein (DUF927 family)
VLECSAKDDYNVTELFKALLSISRILPTGNTDTTTGLKRRSSAYVSATSKGNKKVIFLSKWLLFLENIPTLD